MLKNKEKLYRTGGKPAPRVLQQNEIEHYGFFLPNLKILYDLMDGKFQAQGIEDEAFGKLREKYYNPALPQVGEVVLMIDIGTNKGTRSPRSLSKPWQGVFSPFKDSTLYAFHETLFPKHAHFILKSTPIMPLPVPYMEFYIKAEGGNAGNAIAYFKEGDKPEDTILPS